MPLSEDAGRIGDAQTLQLIFLNTYSILLQIFSLVFCRFIDFDFYELFQARIRNNAFYQPLSIFKPHLKVYVSQKKRKDLPLEILGWFYYFVFESQTNSNFKWSLP